MRKKQNNYIIKKFVCRWISILTILYFFAECSILQYS